MKVNRFKVATHVVDGEIRPVRYIQYGNGDSQFVFERTVDCNCEGGIVPGCDENYECPEGCDRGIKTVDVPCDAIGNTEDSELYLAPITTRIDLTALDLIYTGKVEVL